MGPLQGIVRRRAIRFGGKNRCQARSWAKILRVLGVALCVVIDAPWAFADPINLKAETATAFDRYIAASEAQMNGDAGLNHFLIVDRLPDSQRQAAYDQIQRGEIYIQELHTRQDGRSISIPSGRVHHWAGVIFIPKGTISSILAILNDYDNQANIYKPYVRQSRLVEQSGGDAKLFEQFYSKTIVTVVLNVYFDVTQTRIGSARVQSVSRSTRIDEVENPGDLNGQEQTGVRDNGYMWRLNSYWRIEEKDGGVYVQNESISLTRTIPVLLAWLIEPLTKSIPRDVLTRTLTRTRDAVEANLEKTKKEDSSK